MCGGRGGGILILLAFSMMQLNVWVAKLAWLLGVKKDV